MASNFPAALDNGTSLPNPASSNPPNSPSHAGLHDNENAAIIATQTKVGTGASTPIANTFLFGTGTGTSAWTQATSAQVAAAVSDETGTGALVFATTPSLVTPKVDTINESTTNNGVTVGGVNLKAGIISTASSVGTTALAAASVTPTKLNLAPTTNSTAVSGTTTSTSFTSTLSGSTAQTSTITVGANGLLLVGIWGQLSNSAANVSAMSFALSGANTAVASNSRAVAVTGTSAMWLGASFLVTGLSPGSTVVTMNFAVAAGTGTYGSQHIWALAL